MANYNKYSSNKKKKNKQPSRCPYCGATLQMVTDDKMGFQNKAPDGATRFYWRCSAYPACDAYIAADPKTKKPNGRVANFKLRRGRMIIHSYQDILEKSGMMSSRTFRDTYIKAAFPGLMNPDMAHTRDLDDAQCERILKRLEEVYKTEPKVAAVIDKNTYSLAWRHVRGVAYEVGAYFNKDGDIEEAPEWFEKSRVAPLVSGVENAKKLNEEQRNIKRETARQKRFDHDF